MQDNDLQMDRQSKGADDKINLLDYLIVLLNRKKLIAGITLSFALVAALISLLMSPVYRAETLIFTPQDNSSTASQIMSRLGGAASFSAGALGMKTSNDLYLGLLKSRTVLDNIIDKFKLMSLYGVAYREDARRSLLTSFKASSDKKSSIITISVDDNDPKKAAEIANALVDELKNLTSRLAITEAARKRFFYEEQLKEAKELLSRSEDEMKAFQEKTGALQIETQTKTVIEGIARLRASVAVKEVELKVLKTYAAEGNLELQRVMVEIKGMKEQLQRLEASDGGRKPDPLMSTQKVPSVGTQYIRKLREMKFNETRYELLLQQYEMAKLDEANDSAVVQVIEKAVPPEKRVKPKRRQMVMMSAVMGFMFSLFTVFLLEFKKSMFMDSGNRERLQALKKHARIR